MSPDIVWAQIRHRGGEGLASLGPFRWTARAGGQKVAIQSTQRPTFASGSGAFKKNPQRANLRARARLIGRKYRQVDAVSPQFMVKRRAQLARQSLDDAVELTPLDPGVGIFEQRPAD